MTPRIYANVWQWCELIASSYGPSAHTTRLVLLVLSLHMSRQQNVAWPSQKKIAQRTGLGLRTVKLAVSVANQTGWLHVAGTVDTESGMAWRGNEYTATVPAELAEHLPHFDVVVNRPVEEGGAYGAPPSHGPGGRVVHMVHGGGAYDGTRVVHGMPPESPIESPNESSERAPKKGGAPHAPPSRAQPKSPDDLKSRVSEKSKTTEALRQIASAAMARPIGAGKRKLKPITDSELGEKVRKLREAGCDDALIKRQLSAQASEPQLERVLSAHERRTATS
jgi:hypothetical protein